MIGHDLWIDYWVRRDSLLGEMKSCQRLAEDLRERVLNQVSAL